MLFDKNLILSFTMETFCYCMNQEIGIVYGIYHKHNTILDTVYTYAEVISGTSDYNAFITKIDNTKKSGIQNYNKSHTTRCLNHWMQRNNWNQPYETEYETIIEI